MYNKIVIAMVHPYKEARDYLTSLCKKLNIPLFWVYLFYNGERGREAFHVKDFEPLHGENFLKLNTSILSKDECIKLIKLYIE